MPTTSPRLRSVCFTLNNYEDADITRLEGFFQQEAKYWIIGREIGEQGTPHLQGYATFKRQHTFDALRRLLGFRAHIERSKGNPKQNRDYCSKAEDFTEGGELPTNGGRPPTRDALATDFMVAVGRGAAGVAEFAHSFPGTYIFSGHNMLRNALSIKPAIERPSVSVLWLWGLPGAGKSRRAHELYPNAYVKDPRTKWWNGYMCETDVIIDDFGPMGIDINHLLRWFDRYKCNVETKGGMIPLYACNFIVTSNFEPSDCFKDKDGVPHPQMDALYRRIELEEINM